MVRSTQKKIQDRKIGILGGDHRQLVIAQEFAKLGAEAAVFGFDTYEKIPPLVTKCSSYADAIRHSDAIILPLPCTNDDNLINAPFARQPQKLSDIFSLAEPNQCWFGGRMGKMITDFAAENNISLTDYYNREDISVRNAVPTAEGAIEIAMNELPVTIHDSNSLVLGYGRIGKILSRTLKALGSHVTVMARKQGDHAWITTDGNKPIFPEELTENVGEADVVFNTVPSVIFDSAMLQFLNPDTPIIDIASKPGGVDLDAAKALNRRVIWALSLPAKVAPVTSGKIIFDCIMNTLRKEKGWEDL